MRKILFTSLILLGAFTSNAYAAGYAILEQSAVGVGDAFSGSVVGYGDGSEVFFNPAAMSQLKETTFAWQASLVNLKIDFEDTGSVDSQGNPLLGYPSDGGATMPLASAYFTHPVTEDLTFGLSFNTPYGFVIDYDRDWIGRYKADESNVKVITLNPAVSYKVLPNLSIGANVGVSYVKATLSNAIDFGSLGQNVLGAERASALGLYPQSSDGYAELSGDDWGVNMGLSALYTYGKDDRNKIGVNWRSRIVTNIGADAEFEVPENAAFFQDQGLFVNTSAGAHFTLPESITFGTQYWLTDQLAIQAESAWTNWKRFNELRIRYGSNQPDTVENEKWTDTWRYSLGLVYKPIEALTLRGGWTYDQSAVFNDYRSPRVPDQNRNWMSFGLGYNISECTEIFASYAYLFVHGAESRIGDSYGNQLLGHYDLGIQLVSIGMKTVF